MNAAGTLGTGSEKSLVGEGEACNNAVLWLLQRTARVAVVDDAARGLGEGSFSKLDAVDDTVVVGVEANDRTVGEWRQVAPRNLLQ